MRWQHYTPRLVSWLRLVNSQKKRRSLWFSPAQQIVYFLKLFNDQSLVFGPSQLNGLPLKFNWAHLQRHSGRRNDHRGKSAHTNIVTATTWHYKLYTGVSFCTGVALDWHLQCTGVAWWWVGAHFQVSRPICSPVYVFLVASSDALIILSFRVSLGGGVTKPVT